MSRAKEIRKELKQLNGLQWTKKQALKRVVENHASAQRRMHRNMVVGPEGHPGAKYVPLFAVRSFVRTNKDISELTKDLNQRKRRINQLESELMMIKMSRSKDAYFEEKDGSIFAIHSVGFMDGSTYFQEEIWANNYVKDVNGKLTMRGGSMRVFGDFDEVVKNIKEENPDLKEVKYDAKRMVIS